MHFLSRAVGQESSEGGKRVLIFGLVFVWPCLVTRGHAQSMAHSSKFKFLTFCTLAIRLVYSENVPLNGTCNTALTRLDPATHKMLSDCDSKYFCNNGTCQWKGCRQYDHDINYDSGDPIPGFCSQGTYCPDDQRTCQPLLPLGSRCELDRDGTLLWTPAAKLRYRNRSITVSIDECAPAPASSLANETICLQFICR